MIPKEILKKSISFFWFLSWLYLMSMLHMTLSLVLWSFSHFIITYYDCC